MIDRLEADSVVDDNDRLGVFDNLVSVQVVVEEPDSIFFGAGVWFRVLVGLDDSDGL